MFLYLGKWNRRLVYKQNKKEANFKINKFY